MTGMQSGREDAGGQQVQRVLLALAVLLDDDGVAGVVAAVELDDVVDAAAEQVGRLALALVAPLGSDEHDCRHRSAFRCVVAEPDRKVIGSRPPLPEPVPFGARLQCSFSAVGAPAPAQWVASLVLEVLGDAVLAGGAR